MNFNSNYQALAHHWVHNRDNSCCYGNRMFSEGDKIYSYGRHFLIAQFIKLKNGKEVCLFNTDSYSNTTSKQVWRVKRALPSYIDIIYLPGAQLNKKDNIEYFLQQLEFYCNKEAKAKTIDYTSNISDYLKQFKKYVEYFNIDKRKLTKKEKEILTFTLDNNIQELTKLIIGIRNNILRVRKAAEKKKKKKEIELSKERLQKWLKGEISHGYFYHTDKTYLRVYNNLIQTSNSAGITIEEGWELVEKIKKGKKILGDRIGSYPIVKANGIFQAGCTIIEKDELNRICRELNWEEVF